jgi:isopentenyl-diphosphate delta-isomerase
LLPARLRQAGVLEGDDTVVSTVTVRRKCGLEFSVSADPRPLDLEQVVLVDERDNAVGVEAKLRAHEGGGRLHRAFSVFIVNRAGKMLLQRRARGKYHFGGLWTNACCSHPSPGQDVADAARARLREEFGFDARLSEAFSFVYRANDPGTGLTEHEFDHVFVGEFDGEPQPNPGEIEDWEWVDPSVLLEDVGRHPGKYTPWFRIALERVVRHLHSGGP